jgi:hypothetical protein
MSQVYNPESSVKEELTYLLLEARRLRLKKDAHCEKSREHHIYRQQLQDIENRISLLKTRLVEFRSRRSLTQHAASMVFS